MSALVLEPEVIDLIRLHLQDIQMIQRRPGPVPGRYNVWAVTDDGTVLLLYTRLDARTASAYRDEAEECLVSFRAGQDYPDPDSLPREIPVRAVSQRPHVTRGMPLAAEGRDSLRMRAHRAFVEIDRTMTLKELAKARPFPLGVWSLIGGGRAKVVTRISWHRLGTDKRGYPHKSSYSHYMAEPGRTLCGHPIPSSDTHVVTRGGQGGPLECHLCAGLLENTGAHRE